MHVGGKSTIGAGEQVAESWWAELEAGPSRQFSLGRLTPEQLPTFRRDFLADVERLATPEGIPVPVHVIFASGRVPDA